MSVREIPRPQWPAYLDQFSRDHRAWLATVERVSPDDSRHVTTDQRPLAAVTTDSAGEEVVSISIQFQEDAHAGVAVRIEAPVRLLVEESGNGQARMLEIDDQSGERTRIRFRVPAPAEMLDDVAPGELE